MINHLDTLSDSEKFVIILQKYCNEYTSQKDLAKEMNIPQQSISDWKNNSRSIRIKNRNSISKRFRLTDMVWIEHFDDAINFEEKLEQYKIIEKSSNTQKSKQIEPLSSQNIMLPTPKITNQEKELLALFSESNKITYTQYNTQTMNSSFLFELAILLKNRNQIEEALEILMLIEKSQQSFKYMYHNKIEHLKAILFSHNNIQSWDKAIDILRLLYVTGYHIDEPEIITLLASNYKRKALCSTKNHKEWKDKLDVDLFSSAMILYREAYEAKKGQDRYYDAINFAYLYKISDTIDMEKTASIELKENYKELMSEWEIDKKDWWQVSSHAEFLTLIGQSDLAILNITDFLENNKIEKFHIETTLRQLELYIHFTDDSHAKYFYKYLAESWKAIEKSLIT